MSITGSSHSALLGLLASEEYEWWLAEFDLEPFSATTMGLALVLPKRKRLVQSDIQGYAHMECYNHTVF